MFGKETMFYQMKSGDLWSQSRDNIFSSWVLVVYK